MCRETFHLVDLHSLKVLQKFNSCFDLPMHINRSIIFTLNGFFVTSSTIHSKLCGVFHTPWDSIFFHEINFLF